MDASLLIVIGAGLLSAMAGKDHCDATSLGLPEPVRTPGATDLRGIRLYVDRRLVLDEWRGQSGTAYDWIGDLGEGTHTITLEYFDEGGDATAQLDWAAAIDQPGAGWTAAYWNTPGTASAPTVPSST